jgi:hypothetical protein
VLRPTNLRTRLTDAFGMLCVVAGMASLVTIAFASPYSMAQVLALIVLVAEIAYLGWMLALSELADRRKRR